MMWYLLKSYTDIWGHVVAQLFEALRYKPEGRGFDRWRVMALGSTQAVTEMSTKSIRWWVNVDSA